MTKRTKRLATAEEIEKTLTANAKLWNIREPGFEHDLQFWRDKLAKADAEGYKSEVCACGAVFLSFHHATTCQDSDCPFSDGVSLLDRLTEKEPNDSDND